MAGVPMEFDANVLVNLAHYLDYDFISIGDISACSSGGPWFIDTRMRHIISAGQKTGQDPVYQCH